MTALSARIVDYIGGLTLAGGDHDGRPFTVLPWERRFLRGVFARSRSGDAALSVARGNGKSAVVAAVAAAVVDPSGPLTGRRREVVAVAASFEQSRIIYEDVIGFLSDRYNLGDRSLWRKQDSANRATLTYLRSGARIRCIGAKPGTAHGLRPALVLADEPAQWEAAQADRMLAAIRTGLGKVPGSRLIALGTRPADESHWFSRMIRTADYAQIHAARPDDDPFLLSTIRRANPSLDHLPSLRDRIVTERELARSDPDALASFRALRLNLGTADTDRAVLLDAGTWARVEDGSDPVAAGDYVLGVDLGAGAAMTAAAAYHRSGRLDAFAVFPELPDLRTRGLADGVGGLYRRMADRGELVVAGRRVADIHRLLTESLARWGKPAAIVADRWREAELRDALDRTAFPAAALVVRGMGFRDGGADVRDFRRAVLGGHVRPVESLLMRSAMGEARVVTDPAGNAKLAKGSAGGRRMRARDDAAAAAILAVAAGHRQWHARPSRPRRRRSAVVR